MSGKLFCEFGRASAIPQQFAPRHLDDLEDASLIVQLICRAAAGTF